jgi:hypothetical protein
MIRYFVTYISSSLAGGLSTGNDEIERETPISGIESIKLIEAELSKVHTPSRPDDSYPENYRKAHVVLLSFQRFE